jgi:beta-lactamase superfamily II metal-dependent hydrolase
MTVPNNSSGNRTIKRAISWVAESWGSETLREAVSTSAENESSVILFGMVDDRGILLTGDAGIQALAAAADYAEARAVSIPAHIRFAQVPHHGSRNNVSSSALDRLIGRRSAMPVVDARITAFVSASKESKTHPRTAVVNAFIRRGAKVIPTKGQTIRHHHGMGARPGWNSVEPLPFSEQVEEWA